MRTFPPLVLAGAILYRLDAIHLIPVSVGVLVLGAVAERDADGMLNVGLTVPVCNPLAYLLGPIALTQPHWVARSPRDRLKLVLISRSKGTSSRDWLKDGILVSTD